LANPIASDQSDMRPSLLPGLVAAVQANVDRGFPDLALFEVGQVFRGDRPEDQLIAASGVRHGFASSKGIGRHWSGTATADVFDAKADALAVLSAAGAPMQALQVAPGGASWLHPGRSGTIQIGPQNVLGYFGELHPRALEALGADGPLVAFEVILDRIPDAKQKPTRAKPVLELFPFQPVSRDFAFIVDRTVKAGDIVRAAQGADKKLITAVTVFDVYEGKGIDEAKKSVAISVTMQPREKTMTDQEIEAVAAKIVAEVNKKTGGVLRQGEITTGQRRRCAPSPACGGGLSHMTEYGEEEAVVPAGALDFSAYGRGSRMGSKDIECEPAQDSEVLGSIVQSRPVAVLVEMDVEHPMQLVLDGPVTARDLQQPFGGHVLGQQIMAHGRRLGAIAMQAPARGDAADRNDAREAVNSSQAGIAHDRRPARFAPVVSRRLGSLGGTAFARSCKLSDHGLEQRSTVGLDSQ